jgi:predicted transport protein
MPQNARLSEAWQQELGPEWKDIQTRYLHTIGNLTLTGYNPQLSDRPFYEKRTIEGGFDHSPLRLNQSVAYVERWDQQAIEKRAQLLADEAVKVWAIPTQSIEQVNKYAAKKGRVAALQKNADPINIPDDDQTFTSANGHKTSYTIDDHPYLQGNSLTLFNELRQRILNLSVNVYEEFKKHYIAYKLTTNFVDIEPQKNSLVLTLNMPFEEIDDPLGICEDVTNIGHHGNGQVRMKLAALNQLEYILYLIQQSFERQNSDINLV